MRVCSICGEKNEDWMEICQRCGNSVVNANVVEKREVKKVEPIFNNSNNNQNIKEKTPIENMDLKLVLLVLLVILICLIFYTIHVIS